MALHLTDERPAHQRGRGITGPSLSQLGWAHYWLLVGFLAAGLAFFALVLLAQPPRG
jgi:hypothetical protein